MADAATGGSRAASRAGSDGATRRADECFHRLLHKVLAYDQRGQMLRRATAELQVGPVVLQAGVAKSIFCESFLFLFLGGLFFALMKQKRVFFCCDESKTASPIKFAFKWSFIFFP
jgi:hypothetical protein